MKILATSFILLFTIVLSGHTQDYPDDFCVCEKQIIKSEILNKERILFIYLPNDYYNDSSKKYPVHYIADAPLSSNLYSDIMKLHGLLDYVPQSIVVGLSSNDREFNLHPEKGAENYIKYIISEVVPFMNSTYRTEDFKVLAGHSLSGTFSLYTFLKHNELFDAYIAGSPGPIEPILKLAKELDPIPINKEYKFLYTSVGSQDFTSVEHFEQLQELINTKTSEKFDLHFKVNVGQNHISNMTINHQDGISQLYSDWKFELPDALHKSASQTVIEHYDNLETKFGYRPEIGEWEVIYPIMHKLARRGDFKNAIDILTYCIQLYPYSDQAHAFMAKAYFDTGNFEKGKLYLEKSLELNPQNEFALRMKMMMPQQ